MKKTAFGQQLISEVRDRSIRQWDRIVDGTLKSLVAQQIHSTANLQTLSDVAPKVVDTVLHNLLILLEQLEENGEIRLADVGDESLGAEGLAGELYEQNGWITKFSEYADRRYC
jgi:hypothetical protein